MPRLIELTRLGGRKVMVNADKIVRVYSRTPMDITSGLTVIEHEPFDQFGSLSETIVDDHPLTIQRLAGGA